jgi:signal transduction histidine kinase
MRKYDIGVTGRETYWDIYCVPFKDETGDISSLAEIARDITDQKLAEEHIHALTQQLLKAHESERQMISRELHDKVAQDLLVMKMGLDTLFDDEQTISNETKKRVSRLSDMLLETITVVRDLSYDLRPPHLDRLGLVHTVLRYCEDFANRTGLAVGFNSAGMDDLNLDPNIEINLYRLVQEGLNNIRKHAEADHVVVRLVSSFPNILLRIEDDGRGFDVAERLTRVSTEKRMGLRSMEERVGLLKGRMGIRSAPGEGTKIFIEVPYLKEGKSGSQEDRSYSG